MPLIWQRCCLFFSCELLQLSYVHQTPASQPCGLRTLTRPAALPPPYCRVQAAGFAEVRRKQVSTQAKTPNRGATSLKSAPRHSQVRTETANTDHEPRVSHSLAPEALLKAPGRHPATHAQATSCDCCPSTVAYHHLGHLGSIVAIIDVTHSLPIAVYIVFGTAATTATKNVVF